SSQVDYEAELAVVIGDNATAVPEEDALSYVLGYTCGLDMTARDLQMSDGQWTRAKNFDTFCPLGPWVETELDPGNLDISLSLNGEVKQKSNTSRLIAGVPRLVSFISGVMTLCPGDVIMTGTPSGVGPVQRGDEIEMSIEGIGTLSCKIG
ncbi:MAG TPA: fumarylacetoacetate hydrolase family protein, partial [Candidatus Anoxymicrobiaceae bacterium]